MISQSKLPSSPSLSCSSSSGMNASNDVSTGDHWFVVNCLRKTLGSILQNSSLTSESLIRVVIDILGQMKRKELCSSYS